MNWLLAINILILAIISTAFIIAFLFFRSLISNFRDFVSSAEADKPSPLLLCFDSLAAILARRMAIEVKTTMMGMLSGQSRSAAAEASQLAETELVLDNPAFGALLGLLPKDLKKKALKNPAVVKFIMSKIAGNGQPVKSASTPEAGTEFASRLNQYT